MSYVLAIDEGTTGVRALVLAADGHVAATAYREIHCTYPHPGWVECDLDFIWECTLDVIGQALARAKCTPREIAAIGITNQRSTVAVWDSACRPLHKAIVWQDTRTAARVNELLMQGVFTNTMASAAKAEWFLRNVPAAAEAAAAGTLRVGTIDTWLAAKLSGGRAHVTDPSNASCTTVYDHMTGDWDTNILGILGVPRESMPEIRGSSEVVGMTDASVFGAEVPIAGIAGDQQAAMFGELGFERGAAKVTFGTSGMLDMNSGDFPVFSTRGAYPVVLWSIGGQRAYCLEGTVVTVGAAVQWLRDGLGILAAVEDSGPVAARAGDSGGVWFVPAFQGLGTPHMLPEARAAFGGLSRASGKEQIVRAVLEGIAFRTREVFDTMVEDAGLGRPASLRCDGGAASNDFLLQLVANSLGIPVERPECVQASAIGTAYLAGLAAGVWSDTGSLASRWRSGGVFDPQWSDGERDERFAIWQRNAAGVR